MGPEEVPADGNQDESVAGKRQPFAGGLMVADVADRLAIRRVPDREADLIAGARQQAAHWIYGDVLRGRNRTVPGIFRRQEVGIAPRRRPRWRPGKVSVA